MAKMKLEMQVLRLLLYLETQLGCLNKRQWSKSKVRPIIDQYVAKVQSLLCEENGVVVRELAAHVEPPWGTPGTWDPIEKGA